MVPAVYGTVLCVRVITCAISGKQLVPRYETIEDEPRHPHLGARDTAHPSIDN